MHKFCVKAVERLSKVLVQARHKSYSLHSHFAWARELGLFINNKPQALYPETAINTQPLTSLPYLIKAYLYTLYTGPTNTTNLNKGN